MKESSGEVAHSCGITILKSAFLPPGTMYLLLADQNVMAFIDQKKHMPAKIRSNQMDCVNGLNLHHPSPDFLMVTSSAGCLIYEAAIRPVAYTWYTPHISPGRPGLLTSRYWSRNGPLLSKKIWRCGCSALEERPRSPLICQLMTVTIVAACRVHYAVLYHKSFQSLPGGLGSPNEGIVHEWCRRQSVYCALHSPHSGFSRPQVSTRINHCYDSANYDVSSKEGAVIGAVLGTRKFHPGSSPTSDTYE
jgi:hypothetical protein